MLDLEGLRRVRLGDAPHRWAYIPAAISPEAAAELRASFPATGFWRLRQHDGEKAMDFRLRCVVPLGGTEPVEPESLPGQWATLAGELLSDEYRDAFGAALGVSLQDHLLEVSAWRWGADAFLDPHVDIPRKLASQVFYFNEGWDAQELKNDFHYEAVYPGQGAAGLAVDL